MTFQVGDNVDVGRGVFYGTVLRVREDKFGEPIYTVTNRSEAYVARACEMRIDNATNHG